MFCAAFSPHNFSCCSDIKMYFDSIANSTTTEDRLDCYGIGEIYSNGEIGALNN